MDWDEPLEGDLREEAESALIEMLRSSAVSFPRCVLGEECYKKGWMLLGFWDGGKKASTCCLYARTSLKRRGTQGETHLHWSACWPGKLELRLPRAVRGG